MFAEELCESAAMSSQQEFARKVLAAFRDAGLYNDQEVVAAGGPSTTKMTQLRKVAAGASSMPEPRGDVHGRIDAAAGWKKGSSRRLWHLGAEPEPADPISALPAHVVEVIQGSNVLTDSQKRELLRQLSEPDPHAPSDTSPSSAHSFTEYRANI